MQNEKTKHWMKRENIEWREKHWMKRENIEWREKHWMKRENIERKEITLNEKRKHWKKRENIEWKEKTLHDQLYHTNLANWLKCWNTSFWNGILSW